MNRLASLFNLDRVTEGVLFGALVAMILFATPIFLDFANLPGGH